MRTLSISLSAIIAGISCFAATGDPGADKFCISGNISNIPDSTSIKIMRSNGDMLSVIGQTSIIDGAFTLCGETISSDTEIIYLNSDSPGFPNYLAKVWIAPGIELKVTGDDKLIPLWHIDSPLPQQTSYRNMVQAKMPEFKQSLESNIEESDLLRFLYVEKEGADEYVGPTWKKINSLRAVRQPLDSIMDVKTYDYMKQAPIDEVWLDECLSFTKGSVMGYNKYLNGQQIEELYSRMSDADKETRDGMIIEGYLSIGKPLGENDEMADGILYDINGNKHKLSDYKGKYIFLDFWSAGCGPCIMSIPEAEKAAEMYSDRLAFISISTDPEDIWKNTVESRNMKGIQLNELKGDTPGLAQKYGTAGIPHYVLIDPDGKIMKMWRGYGEGILIKRLSEQLPDKQQ